MSGSAEQQFKYRLTFPEDNFGVVKAMVQEDVERDLRDEQPPRASDIKILNMAEPFLLTRSPEDIEALAVRLEAFADRTDYEVTDLAMDWPKEVAEGLIDDRRSQAAAAATIARSLRAEKQWLDALGEQPLDFDGWASGLDPAA